MGAWFGATMSDDERRGDEMTDEQTPPVVLIPGGAPERSPSRRAEDVHHPAKAFRIAGMVRQLLDEVKQAPLDEASRSRLRDIYQRSIDELGDVLSEDLKDELSRLSLPFESDSPSEGELRIAHAQLMGWLEGLFHGIQAALFAQQMEGRAQLEELQRRSLPPRVEGPEGRGTYL